MAGTIAVSPVSMAPQSGSALVGRRVHTGGTNSRRIEGMGVAASIASNASWWVMFRIPDTLGATPAPKLRLTAVAAATANDAKINPLWAIVTEGTTVYDTVTLNAEGTTTLTWAAGDSDRPKVTEITLDATTFAQGDAGKLLYIEIRFETASWTLAVASTWLAQLVVDTS